MRQNSSGATRSSSQTWCAVAEGHTVNACRAGQPLAWAGEARLLWSLGFFQVQAQQAEAAAVPCVLLWLQADVAAHETRDDASCTRAGRSHHHLIGRGQHRRPQQSQCLLRPADRWIMSSSSNAASAGCDRSWTPAPQPSHTLHPVAQADMSHAPVFNRPRSRPTTRATTPPTRWA